MPTVRRSALVSQPPEVLFDLVNDVAAYPRRFGWCSRAQILEHSDQHLVARLDLGSVLVPMPAGAQVQVELTDSGVPSAVWLVTPNGRFNVAAYAAPETTGGAFDGKA